MRWSYGSESVSADPADAQPDNAGENCSASVQQLLVLANIESLNAEFIQMGLPQRERLQKLNAVAIRQMRSLTGSPALMRLASLKGKGGDPE